MHYLGVIGQQHEASGWGNELMSRVDGVFSAMLYEYTRGILESREHRGHKHGSMGIVGMGEDVSSSGACMACGSVLHIRCLGCSLLSVYDVFRNKGKDNSFTIPHTE